MRADTSAPALVSLFLSALASADESEPADASGSADQSRPAASASMPAISGGIPERDQLRALVSRMQRIRDTKAPESLTIGSTQQFGGADRSNVRIWGKHTNAREFLLNEDGTATYVVRGGETIRSVVADVLREIHRDLYRFEPSYAELAYTIAEVKEANSNICDFDMLNYEQRIVIPSSLVQQAVA